MSPALWSATRYSLRRHRDRQHFDTTPFLHPPYSANCIPFKWMLRDGAAEKAELLKLEFDEAAEEAVHEGAG